MKTPDTTVGKLSMDDRELVDSRTAYEVGRRKYIVSLPSTRLAAFMSLCGERLKPPTICRLLGMDEGELYQVFTTSYSLSQEQQEVIDKLYAVGAAAWHDSNGDWRKARARLTKKSHMLIKDPTDSSSPERSILEAVADGDLDQVISVMDYQLGDFNSDVTAKDS